MTLEKALEDLEKIDLDIEQVRQIFEEFKEDMQVVGMVAMNVSRRCSVYDATQEKSQTLIELLRDLSMVEDMGSRWAVAKNHFTPIDVLMKLADDKINLVRALVATNPNTPVSILQKLFSDEKIVRDGLSGNPNTPNKLLSVLANDSDKMVRLRVAENPSTPKEILISMLEDSDFNVAKAAEVKLGEKS